MRKRRVWFFLLTIAIGISAGLVYGWVINPLNQAEVTPRSLRMDYKTDYVLMVAEIHQADQNVTEAVTDLEFLAEKDPLDLVDRAIAYAKQLGYLQEDIDKMDHLSVSIKHDSGER